GGHGTGLRAQLAWRPRLRRLDRLLVASAQRRAKVRHAVDVLDAVKQRRDLPRPRVAAGAAAPAVSTDANVGGGSGRFPVPCHGRDDAGDLPVGPVSERHDTLGEIERVVRIAPAGASEVLYERPGFPPLALMDLHAVLLRARERQ